MSVLPGGQLVGDPEETLDDNDALAIADTTVTRANIETDAGVITATVFDRLRERAPGWIPRDGNLDTWLIEEWATVAAELRQEAVRVPDAIYVAYGQEVLGIPMRPPAPAHGESTWRAIDPRGYTIPAGTQFTLARSGSDLVVFETTAAREIPFGETEIEGVPFNARDEGYDGNDLSGPGDVVDPLAWVESIEVPEPTFGGDDGQDPAAYLDQLVMLMRVVAIRPILPWDFALLALRIPGVGRAVAMDGYEPLDDTWGHARQITLVITDMDGYPCSAPTKDAVRAYLEALREVNFKVIVIDAHYEDVDVEYTVTAFAEQSPEVVLELCDNAVYDSLSPMRFRLGTTSPAIEAGEVIPAPADPDEPFVPGRQAIRVNNLVGLLDRQRGVDWVNDDAVLVNGNPADLIMTGPTTLPRPGEITGHVEVQ